MRARQTLMNILIAAVVPYVLLLGYLYINQRQMMYFPDTSKPQRAEWYAQSAEIIAVETQDGLTLEGWYFAPAAPNKPIIIYFHGNGSHIGERVGKTGFLRQEGYGLLLAGYRGYGGNPGRPTEEGLYKDARAYINGLQSQHGIKTDQIVLYGESLGTAVAVQMATEHSVSSIILEAPFHSALGLAQDRYFYMPVSWLMKDQYRSDLKISDLSLPILILHGTKDEITDMRYGQALFERATMPKIFVPIVDAGHLDVYDHGAALHVLDFLRNIAERAPKLVQ